MVNNGSATARTTVPVWAALLAWVVGVAAMGAGMLAARPYGIRAALAVAEACLVTPGVLAVLAWGIPLARGLALARPTARVVLLAVLAGGTLWAASVGLLELQYAFWEPAPGFLEAFRQLHAALKPSGPFDALVSIAAIAIAPAVCEELLFRGVILPSFARWLGAGAGIAISSALFGIIHSDGFNFYRVPFAFAVAVGFGVMRVRTGSLVPGLVAHAVLNTITFLAVLAGVDSETPGDANVLHALALLAGGLVASVFVLRRFPRPPGASA